MAIRTIGELKAALAAFPDDWEVFILNRVSSGSLRYFTLGAPRKEHVDLPTVILPVDALRRETVQRYLDIVDRCLKYGMCTPEDALDTKRRIEKGEFGGER